MLLKETIKIVMRYDGTRPAIELGTLAHAAAALLTSRVRSFARAVSMKQAIVSPPWVFKPMWTVMKRAVVPREMLPDILFVKSIGFDYASAQRSSAAWYAQVAPLLKPDGFVSALRSLFHGVARCATLC